MTDAVPTDSGPLTVEQAVESLLPQPTPEVAPEAPVEAAESPEPIEAEETPAETAEGEPEEAAEGEEEAVEEVAEPLEAPKYWSQDAKAKFAALDPDLQAVVLSQEGPREEAAAKAKTQAAEAIQAAEKEVAGVQKLAEQLASFLPEAVKVFKDKWEEVDWEAYAAEDPTAAFQDRLKYEAQQKHLQSLAAATQEAERQAHQAFLKEESAKLPEIAPDLADPIEGPARRTEVAKFLLTQGVAPEQLQTISAVEMALAYDAMRYRTAKQGLAAAPKPKPVAPKPVIAKAAAAVASSPTRPADQARNRFAQTRSIDDAVAVLLSRK